MSGHPPPPPSRKPPAANPPAPRNPRPPVAQPTGGYAEEPPPTSSTSPGTILAIIAGVLLLLIGLPILACVGFVAVGRYQFQRLEQQHEAETEQVETSQSELERLREKAFLSNLSNQLHKHHAKDDIKKHWAALSAGAKLRWRDWNARKIHSQRYEVSGDLSITGTQAAGHHEWACQYSTSGDAKDPDAEWTLERIVIDGQQVYP